jgi:ubiquinone/menaquinone biosynthesis C-methylase UbiE
MEGTFDKLADEYDAWYDSPEGSHIYREELECVLLVKGRVGRRWMEAGAGTGRFGSMLGVRYALDPSQPMLRLASKRGMRSIAGTAEALPFADGCLDGVMMVVALSFCHDPSLAIRECARVIRRAGALVVAIVPRTSPWGQHYTQKGAAGHPLYSHARFLAIEELVVHAAVAGLVLRDAASALLWPPERESYVGHAVQRGAIPGAGFVALRFEHPS